MEMINHKKNVGILPLGNPKKEHVEEVANSIREYYKKDVYVLPKTDLPRSAFTKIRFPRYRADSILKFLKRVRPDTIDNIMAITNVDISTTKRKNGEIKKPKWKYIDFGIYGLGYRPGKASVVSTYRLIQYSRTKKILLSRLRKICLHELGHNLGLKHCEDPNCLMTDANESIKTIDGAKEDLCSKCKRTVGIKD